MPDVGVAALERIRERLMIDEEWLARGERHFSWFAYRLEQTVSASSPVERNDLSLCLLTARTHVVEQIQAPDEHVERLVGLMNSIAVGSALVFDPTRHTVHLVLAHHVHGEVLDGRVEDLAAYGILQLCEAEFRAEALATAFDGRVAEREHATNGPRLESDEMLNVVSKVFAPQGAEPSHFLSEGEMERVYQFCARSPYASMGFQETGVCIEVAFDEASTTLIELGSKRGAPLAWIGTRGPHHIAAGTGRAEACCARGTVAGGSTVDRRWWRSDWRVERRSSQGATLCDMDAVHPQRAVSAGASVGRGHGRDQSRYMGRWASLPRSAATKCLGYNRGSLQGHGPATQLT